MRRFATPSVFLLVLSLSLAASPEIPRAQTPTWSTDDMQFFLHGSMSTEVVPEILEGSLMLASHALMLIGDPEYYERLFGFNAAQTGGWEVPGPVERHRLLARLRSDRVDGLSGMIAPDPDRNAILR